MLLAPGDFRAMLLVKGFFGDTNLNFVECLDLMDCAVLHALRCILLVVGNFLTRNYMYLYMFYSKLLYSGSAAS